MQKSCGQQEGGGRRVNQWRTSRYPDLILTYLSRIYSTVQYSTVLSRSVCGGSAQEDLPSGTSVAPVAATFRHSGFSSTFPSWRSPGFSNQGAIGQGLCIRDMFDVMRHGEMSFAYSSSRHSIIVGGDSVASKTDSVAAIVLMLLLLSTVVNRLIDWGAVD